MVPKELIDSFAEKFGSSIYNIKDDQVTTNVGDYTYSVLWFEMDRDILHDAVKHLIRFQYPHIAVISGKDLGDEIELIYHFSVGYGSRRGEQSVNFRVRLAKSDLRVPTITDLVPGALTSEREKIEFLGVEFEDIPDSRNIFLPYDMKEHPWRRDETGVNAYE